MSAGDRLVSAVRAQVLEIIRRGPGEVIWAPGSVRGGNLLYLWLHAFDRRQRGVDCRVLHTEPATAWLDEFPALRALVAPRASVHWSDRRIVAGPMQSFGKDFDAGQLDAFIEQMMASVPSRFADRVSSRGGSYDLTINVRRGDYYSVPKWRGEYSFDVVEYLRVAVQQVQQQAPISRIHVVSDDLTWCRIKMHELERIAPVTFAGDDEDAFDHLAALAASPRLILANSTFSYWGGYLSDWWGKLAVVDRPRGIWAPSFHNRFFPNGGRATQLNPNWNVVEDIPGGWDG